MDHNEVLAYFHINHKESGQRSTYAIWKINMNEEHNKRKLIKSQHTVFLSHIFTIVCTAPTRIGSEKKIQILG